MDIINRCIDDNINICSKLDNEMDEILDAKKNDVRDILVLSGGGRKVGIHAGALKALDKLDMLRHIKIISGTSVGAIVGLLYSVGYSIDQLYVICSELSPTHLKSNESRNIIFDYGMDSGKNFWLIYGKLIEIKGFKRDITFKEHYNKSGIKLIMTGSCLNDKKCYYFSKDTFPDMKVIEALRITASIPGAFVPHKFEGKYFIDGGCTENYPIRKFRYCKERVVGIYLLDMYDEYTDINNFEEFIFCILGTMLRGLETNCYYGYEECSVIVKPGKLETAFTTYGVNVSKSEINRLCELGYSEVMKKYSTSS